MNWGQRISSALTDTMIAVEEVFKTEVPDTMGPAGALAALWSYLPKWGKKRSEESPIVKQEVSLADHPIIYPTFTDQIPANMVLTDDSDKRINCTGFSNCLEGVAAKAENWSSVPVPLCKSPLQFEWRANQTWKKNETIRHQDLQWEMTDDPWDHPSFLTDLKNAVAKIAQG